MDLSWSSLTTFSWLLQVHYTFNKVLMLQEPLLVVAAFYILFFTVIVYVRLDFSITKVLCSLPSCQTVHRTLWLAVIPYIFLASANSP